MIGVDSFLEAAYSAALDDSVAVYRELLKRVPPQKIASTHIARPVEGKGIMICSEKLPA